MYTFTYDNANDLKSVDGTFSGAVTHVLLTYIYDALHNRINLTDNQASNDVLTYTYDDDHHLTYASLKASGTQGPQVTLSYDSQNRLQSIVRATPSTVTITSNFSYDTDNRLTTLTHSTTTSALATYTYHYDNASRVDGSTALAGEANRSYAYDNSNQLTTVTNSSTSAVLESYTYDLNGNRTSANGVTYGAPGAGNRLVNDGVYTYTYDNEGNMQTRSKSGELTTFTWDYRNRLTEVVRTVGTVVTDDKKRCQDPLLM